MMQPAKEVYTRRLPKEPQTLESFRQEQESKFKQNSTLLDNNVISKDKEEVASTSRNKCRRRLILSKGSSVEASSVEKATSEPLAKIPILETR